MYTYAFTNKYGLGPGEAEAALAGFGIQGASVQILHYTRPRVVMVMSPVELTESARQQLADAIAQIRGVDPAAPAG